MKGRVELKHVRIVGSIVLMMVIISTNLHVMMVGYRLRSRINGVDEVIPISYEASDYDYTMQENAFNAGRIEDFLEEKDREILVMSFNIRHGADWNGKESLNLIIDEIKAFRPQIIALQEVDYRMPRSRFKDQTKVIADALGFDYVYGSTINFLGMKYGNAIISAYPIEEYRSINLPSGSLEGRAVLKAKINIDGEIYHVLNTHLGLNEKERNRQIDVINNIIKEIDGNIILMGDFNEEPNTLEAKEINRKMVDTAVVTENEFLYTYAYCNEVPNTRIDHIYVSRDVRVVDHFVVPSGISDHSMVFSLIFHKTRKKRGII